MADERLIPPGIRDASTLALNSLIDRMGTVDLTPMLVYLVDNVVASALPHLLEQFHVAGTEGGTLAENATNRRSLIKRAIALHRIKGTPAGLKQAISDAGFGAVEIIERPGELKYNGAARYDGLHTYGPDADEWAEYHLTMSRPVTHDQAELIRALCYEFAPARCLLKNIVYTEAALRYNGAARYDGSYNYGTI